MRQDSFAGGEIDPKLYGRIDLARYNVSVRRCRNFVPTPFGALENRAGTTYIATEKYPYQNIRLIPFIFSEDANQTYVLEFGFHYIRFYSNGAQIMNPTYPTIPLEVTTSYTVTQIASLKYSQRDDVLVVTCTGCDVYELRRLSHTSWTFTAVDYDPDQPNGLAYISSNDIYANSLLVDATHPAKPWQWKFTELYQLPSGFSWETAPKNVVMLHIDQANWVPIFTYPIDAVVNNGSGTYYKSLQNGNLNHAVTDPVWWAVTTILISPPPAYSNPIPSTVVLYPDTPLTIQFYSPWGALIKAPDGSDPMLMGRRIYRGKTEPDYFGYIGDDGVGYAPWLDVGDLPDLSNTPPKGTNPFKIYGPTGTLLRTEQPSVVGHVAGRRVFANTAERPSTLLFSSSLDPYNFDRHIISKAIDSFVATISASLREEIRWVKGYKRHLLAGTQSSIWLVGPPQGTVLSDETVEFNHQGDIGSSWLDPLIVPPNIVLYVRTKGCGVRDLVFDENSGNILSSNVSMLAQHLFTGHEVVSWAYTEDPNSTLWLVRDDGIMLSLTYLKEQEVLAWAWHDTQGLIEDVCAIPEGSRDVLYLSVQRQQGNLGWTRYIERMSLRSIPEDVMAANNYNFLDCAKVYSGVPTQEITGLEYLEGKSVNVLANGNVVADGLVVTGLIVTDGKITLPTDLFPDGVIRAQVGLSYASEVELLDEVAVTSYSRDKDRLKHVDSVIVEIYKSRGFKIAESVDEPDDNWVEWDQREVSDEYGALSLYTGSVKISPITSWNRTGRIAIRQTDPLPLTIVSIDRKTTHGDS